MTGSVLAPASGQSGGACDRPVRLVRLHPPELFQREAIALTAAEDINSDFRVDAIDLAIILGAWGTSQNLPDLNGDNIVDATDFAIALGGWSGADPCVVRLCDCSGGTSEGSGEQIASSSGGEAGAELQLAFALNAVGFNSADELAIWAAEAESVAVLAALDAIAAVMKSMSNAGGDS